MTRRNLFGLLLASLFTRPADPAPFTFIYATGIRRVPGNFTFFQRGETYVSRAENPVVSVTAQPNWVDVPNPEPHG